MAKNYWIIDTDGGVDDCQALVLALSSPLIEVVAVTTVAGNVHLPLVIRNVAETLRICDRRNIPFYVGCERPLISTLVPAENIHGKDGLNNYWDSHNPENLPEPVRGKTSVEAILELSKTYAGEISIVTIGPLTNLALAIALDPDLHRKFKRVLVMGAAVHAKGNRTVCSEFNV